jgi:beta-barrel assembly-enhancing protease
MKKTLFFPALAIFLVLVSFSGCSKSDSVINIFTLQDDITLGQQADQQIRQNPAEFQVLDSTQYATAYQDLYRIRNTILASGKVKYASQFPWRWTILRNDTIINAFCLPGGYMYVYTGLIKFLDNEAEFAGVMGHEMAHADLRHTTDQLTVTYGLNLLLDIVLGNNTNQLEQIVTDLATGLGTLAYSREQEYQADKNSVIYLYPTEYDASSIGNFFVKIEGEPQPPVFLSTHPSPSDRLQKINEEFLSLGGIHGGTFIDRYNQFKGSLP